METDEKATSKIVLTGHDYEKYKTAIIHFVQNLENSSK